MSLCFMRKSVDISDKFDSASETEWISNNWELEPHTRDIKRFLFPIGMMTVMAGLLGSLFYLMTAENRWRDGMRELYAPYKSAVVQIEKLEHCDKSWCFEKKRQLVRQRDEAWKGLCAAENSEEYIRRLRNENKPYQACE